MSMEQSAPNSRSIGVQHRPEADIQSIRDLIKGYDGDRSIFKELIQNAEDAQATRLNLIIFPGNPDHSHPLLRGPGLLAVNDGDFDEQDRNAIPQINLGTKGTTDRAIGRFGKGLKSVFAWCESFFIVARTNAGLGWGTDFIADLFNPWDGWRHQDWMEEFDRQPKILQRATQDHIGDLYRDGEPWLAFWFPLRHPDHGRDGQGVVKWIHQTLPGTDPRFASSLRKALSDLAPSLVMLRNLRQITIIDRTISNQSEIIWEFPQSSQRIPAPDGPQEVNSVAGECFLRETTGEIQKLHYTGWAGVLSNPKYEALKDADDWPTVGEDRVKGKPHFASLVTVGESKEAESGCLQIRWCVFFPVGKQPVDAPIQLNSIKKNITINLHGFFFLDSDRLRIDGLEDRFQLLDDSGSKACIDWNQSLTEEGVLAHLPRIISTFAETESLLEGQCEEIARAIREGWLWESFQQQICKEYTWRPRWRQGDATWECIPNDRLVLQIPAFAGVTEVQNIFPQLVPLAEDLVLVTPNQYGELQGLYYEMPVQWPEDRVLQLLSGAHLDPNDDGNVAKWLNLYLEYLHDQQVLTSAIRARVADLPLIQIRDGQTDNLHRVSANTLHEQKGRLFSTDDDTSIWLQFIRSVLPEWSFVVADESDVPRWYDGPIPVNCDASVVARIILVENILGAVSSRVSLAKELIQSNHSDFEVDKAIRFLIHGNANYKEDTATLLFLPSSQPNQKIWSRLINQLLEKSSDQGAWRLLDSLWGDVLTLELQRRLKVASIEAEGALRELVRGEVNISELVFDDSIWNARELSLLIRGLYDAGNDRVDDTLSLLRTLPIHMLSSQPNVRVSIADAQKALDDTFVLDSPRFANDLSADLRPYWETFLSTTTVIARLPDNDIASTVQKELFKKVDSLGDLHITELNWNFVVRRCFECGIAPQQAPLVIEALKVDGNKATSGLRGVLAPTKWLPLSSGGLISPGDVLSIDGLDTELSQLLDPEQDGLAGLFALEKWVYEHPGFPALRNFLPRVDRVIETIALWLAEKPDWHLGLSESNVPSKRGEFLRALETLGTLPGAILLSKMQNVAQNDQVDGLESLLETILWPALLRPFPEVTNDPSKLVSVLIQLGKSRTRMAFDAYLRQACDDKVIRQVLPQLDLVNQHGQWLPSRGLLWPSYNLDPAVQVCQGHADILRSLRPDHMQEAVEVGEESVDGSVTNQLPDLPSLPDFGAEVKKIEEYVKPFRNGNIGDNLPAALVAVLGEQPEMEELLETLLESDLKRTPEDFRAWLLRNEDSRLLSSSRRLRFLIEVVHGQSITAKTITEETIEVGLTADVQSLIVGNPTDLWWRYFYKNRPETECHKLKLRWIDKPDDLQDPTSIFSKTIETIVLKVFCNGVPELVPSIEDALIQIADAGQTNLRRSQITLLDIAEARLKELGVRDVPELAEVMRIFQHARQARLDGEDMEGRVPGLAKEKMEEGDRLLRGAKKQLLQILEEESGRDIRLSLVECIRRKMTEFQYDLASVPFELFQNADDAVAELVEVKNSIQGGEEKFVLQYDSTDRQLLFFHWGRPINRHNFPGFSDGERRGFHQDLEKMLTLNFSEKGIGDSSTQTTVTGRFGLGFKSVFFVTDQPEVVSGRLAFQVRGGFYPVPLQPSATEELRERAAAFGYPSSAPTIVRLKCKDWESDVGIEGVLNKFQKYASLLSIFARNIREITLSIDGVDTTLRSVEQPLTQSGYVHHIQAGNDAYVAFRCALRQDKRPATILLGLGSEGIIELPDDLPNLWITNPTSEHSDMSWALNAPFKPDAGRQRLALDNPENRAIAEEISLRWGEALVELYNALENDWSSFVDKVKLHANIDAKQWWQSFWAQVARVKPKSSWDTIRDGGQVLGWIAWGNSVGGMCKLVRECPIIPSGLPGKYALLVKSDTLQFKLGGLLATLSNGCFEQVAGWRAVIDHFPVGQLVASDVGDFLIAVNCVEEIEKVDLERVFRLEVGSENNAAATAADRIGILLKGCAPIFEAHSSAGAEIRVIEQWMRSVNFLADNGVYQAATNLVCNIQIADQIEMDESLRAAFAPDDAVLSSVYSEDAIHFFIKARGRLTAGAERLAEWVRESGTSKLSAVFRYLIEGDLAQELADQLGRGWFDTNRGNSAFTSLIYTDQLEIDRKFLRGQHWDIQPPIPIPLPIPPATVMPPSEAFRRISEWWERDQDRYTSSYNEQTYPPGFPGTLPWRSEDEWDVIGSPGPQERWLFAFINAALVPLGFNNIGRHQSFSQFLVDNRWLDVLANVPQDTRPLFAALDRYLEMGTQTIAFHFPMRQFIAFYAVARNIDAFVDTLYEAERSDDDGAFLHVFAPRANASLTGTGIDAPAVSSMLGIGTCQLLRELYRLNRLTNPLGYPFAFTPIRKVRQLCAQLFDTPENLRGRQMSEALYARLRSLAESAGTDPTFNHCFDLPFQFLAERPHLRNEILGVDFETDSMDSDELDAAPPTS